MQDLYSPAIDLSPTTPRPKPSKVTKDKQNEKRVLFKESQESQETSSLKSIIKKMEKQLEWMAPQMEQIQKWNQRYKQPQQDPSEYDDLSENEDDCEYSNDDFTLEEEPQKPLIMNQHQKEA